MMVACSITQAKSLIEGYQPRVVLIDLTAGDMAAPSALIGYQGLLGVGTWFVGFGPHVDVSAIATARVAGCHVVMTRSKFAADLADLMHLYFNQPRARKA
jgi:hypothetical protein